MILQLRTTSEQHYLSGEGRILSLLVKSHGASFDRKLTDVRTDEVVIIGQKFDNKKVA